MALTSTMYNFLVSVSDVDRGVYENLKLAAAMHPSETPEFLITRVLAYCLEYEEGLTFTKGLSNGEEPAIWLKSPDDRILKWIEIGFPTAARLHRASKLAGRVAVYTHRAPQSLIQQLSNETIHRARDIPIFSFEDRFIKDFASRIERRTTATVSITDRHLYLEIDGVSLNTTINEQPAGS